MTVVSSTVAVIGLGEVGADPDQREKRRASNFVDFFEFAPAAGPGQVALSRGKHQECEVQGRPHPWENSSTSDTAENESNEKGAGGDKSSTDQLRRQRIGQ